jgi:CubicO group peptidase (beta-lactamase class C family)
MTRRPSLLLAAVLTASLLPPTHAANPTARTSSSAEARRLGAAIDAYARPLIAAEHLSGQLLVARGGQILVERSYGYASWELRAPVTAETRFNVASVTKPMTGTIAIQLLGERKLGLADSIARWFPDFPQGRRITVAQLLQHSSGIPHELWPDSEATRPVTTAQVVERAKTRPLDHEPGARSGYSSGGFSVLTRILELASGKSYAELLSERIFTPLGMTHSSNHDSRALLEGRASGVVPGAHGIQNAAFQDFSAIVGAGSVWSTARDLHRFVAGLVSGRLGRGPQYSYVRDGKIDFNGIGGGFRAYCDWDSLTGLEVIFVGNLQTGAPDLLRAAIPRLAAGQAVPPPALPALRTTPLTTEELGRLEATYQLGNGTKLVVRAHDGTLWANEWVLLPMAEGGFFSPRDYGKVRGVAGPDGRIERLDWEQRGEIYPAPRVAG